MKSFEYPTELYEKKHKQFRNLRTVLKKLKIENKPLYKVIKEIFVIEKN